MIIIQDVEFLEVPEDENRVIYHSKPFYEEGEILPRGEKIEEEIVKGRKFTNGRGETVVLGMREEVQKLLGMPFGAFKQYEDLVASQSRRYLNLYRKINNADFWQRLKYLFTGEL